jgi:ankyrin repeat protein
MHCAAYTGSSHLLPALLRAGGKINATAGLVRIYTQCGGRRCRGLPYVRANVLVREARDASLFAQEANTPLQLACEEGHVQMVEELLLVRHSQLSSAPSPGRQPWMSLRCLLS